MNFFNLLGGIFNVKKSEFTKGGFDWLYPIAQFLDNMLIPIILIALIAGGAWVIVLGVNLAKAEDSSKAAEAKKRLINVVIAIVAVIVFIFLLAFLANNLPSWSNNPFSK